MDKFYARVLYINKKKKDKFSNSDKFFFTVGDKTSIIIQREGYRIDELIAEEYTRSGKSKRSSFYCKKMV